MKNLKLLPLLLLPVLPWQVQAETEEERRARLAIPVLEVKAPVAGVKWVANYIPPSTVLSQELVKAKSALSSGITILLKP